jgi:hypothetical protein
MTTPVHIIDGKGTAKKTHLFQRNGDVGQIVYTDRLIIGTAGAIPYLNATYGASMNQNVTFGGTPEIIHDGGDTSAWTATAVQGAWDFTTGAVITLTDGNNNDEALFEDSGGGTVDMSSYTALTGKITLTTYTPASESILLNLGLAGVLVGNTIDLNDYIDTGLFGTQQSFAIPKADLGINGDTIDELVIVLSKASGPKPTFAFDDLQIEETGNPEQFIVNPPAGTKYHVTKLVLTVADTGTGGTAYAYDQWGGIASLTNGINLRTEIGGSTLFSATIRQLSDFLAAGGSVDTVVDDGTDTLQVLGVKLFETEPVILDSRDNDRFVITINDNLSGLLEFRAFARGYQTDIT